MIWILGIVLGLLVVSQIHLYSIIKKSEKQPKIEKGGIILKPLPEKVDSDLVEGAEEMLSEVLESVKLEGWVVDITDNSIYGEAYNINIKSHNEDIIIDSVIRYRSYLHDDFEARLIRFRILTDDINGIKSYSFTDSKYKNDIIVFLWDFILEKHLEENRIEIENCKSTINTIRKKLTGLRRSERLNQLLDE
mgnify:CR=1 FL=1|jgi:hypothetical protein